MVKTKTKKVKPVIRKKRVEWKQMSDDQRVIELNSTNHTWTPSKPVEYPCFLKCGKAIMAGDKTISSRGGAPNPATVAHHSCWLSRSRQLIAIEGGSNIAKKKIERVESKVAEAKTKYKPKKTTKVESIGIKFGDVDYKAEFEKLQAWKEGLEQGLSLAKGRQ